MFFFFNDTATTEIYTLSLHDALPILPTSPSWRAISSTTLRVFLTGSLLLIRSEEHTSELQSHSDSVCRLLLEKQRLPNGVDCLVVGAHACYILPLRLHTQ